MYVSRRRQKGPSSARTAHPPPNPARLSDLRRESEDGATSIEHIILLRFQGSSHPSNPYLFHFSKPSSDTPGVNHPSDLHTLSLARSCYTTKDEVLDRLSDGPGFRRRHHRLCPFFLGKAFVWSRHQGFWPTNNKRHPAIHYLGRRDLRVSLPRPFFPSSQQKDSWNLFSRTSLYHTHSLNRARNTLSWNWWFVLLFFVLLWFGLGQIHERRWPRDGPDH